MFTDKPNLGKVRTRETERETLGQPAAQRLSRAKSVNRAVDPWRSRSSTVERGFVFFRLSIPSLH